VHEHLRDMMKGRCACMQEQRNGRARYNIAGCKEMRLNMRKEHKRTNEGYERNDEELI